MHPFHNITIQLSEAVSTHARYCVNFKYSKYILHFRKVRVYAKKSTSIFYLLEEMKRNMWRYMKYLINKKHENNNKNARSNLFVI